MPEQTPEPVGDSLSDLGPDTEALPPRSEALELSRWTRFRKMVTGHPLASLGVAFIVVLLLWSLFGPLPHDPRSTASGSSLAAPGAEHWFGADSTGGDVFSRVIDAARIDLSLALAGTAVALVFGVPLGLAASTKGKGSQRLIRALDAFQAFPLLILALVLVSLSGNKIYMVVVAIALLNIPRYMRLLRSEVLSLRESRFVEAAIAMGATTPRLIFKHLLPNVWGVILVQTSLTIANAIVVLASLSFLGVGVAAPTPSWGGMIRVGAGNMASGQWWIATFPGLAVLLCVLAFNRLADVISDSTARSYR